MKETYEQQMKDIAIDSGIDHDEEVPVSERTGSGAYSMAMLCKQDKEQLDRIEAMLNDILEGSKC